MDTSEINNVKMVRKKQTQQSQFECVGSWVSYFLAAKFNKHSC